MAALAPIENIHRGSKVHITHGILVDDDDPETPAVPLLTGYTYADVPFGEDPVTFAAPVTYEGAAGHWIGPDSDHEDDPAGLRVVWAKVVDDQEVPLILAGYYRLI